MAAFSEDGALRAIVDVKYSHATMGEALGSNLCRVGTESVCEVNATRVINSQSRLHSTEVRSTWRRPTYRSASHVY